MRFKPYFCIGCGAMVTREPWPHLSRDLLSPEVAARLDNPSRARPIATVPAPQTDHK